MTDLVERLRDMADPKRVGSHFHPLYGEAAERIEELERALKELHQAVLGLSKFEGDKTLFEAPLVGGTPRAHEAWMALARAQAKARAALEERK